MKSLQCEASLCTEVRRTAGEWVCSHCWAVNNPVTERTFVRPSSLVACTTFHPKMWTCRFQNIFFARFKFFTLVLMKTEVLCGVTLCHWVSTSCWKGHSYFSFMVKPSKNAWIWSWKHQNLRNVSNILHNNIVLHPQRLESSKCILF
jgi:hypothetical protein